MKKVYLFLAAMMIAGVTFGQVAPGWWQMLPEDYDSIPYERQELTITNVTDDLVGTVASLAELWDEVDENAFAIDAVTKDTVYDAADFTGQAAAFWDASMIYILYNVTDEEVNTDGKDFLEISIAPYADQYDPGREIYPSGYDAEGATPDDPYDYDYWGRDIAGDVYVDMALYATWNETGANKSEIKLTQVGDTVRPTYVKYELNNDSLGANAGTASLDEDCLGAYEATDDGYLYLLGMPWATFHAVSSNEDIYSWDVPTEGVWDAISLAVKVNDYDADNQTNDDDETETTNIWGGTDKNDAYVYVAYYGAVASFDFPEVGIANNKVSNPYNIYYAQGNLHLDGIQTAGDVIIYNITGQKVMNLSNVSNGQYDISNLNNGIYVVTFKGAAQKIVKY